MTTKIISGLKITHQLYKCKDGSQSLRFFSISKSGGRTRIGTIKLYMEKANRKGMPKKYWETHSQLSKPYRGRGIGQWMYQRAIDIVTQRGERITSSCYPSHKAQYAWRSRSLNRKYKITERYSDRFVVKGRKRIR